MLLVGGKLESDEWADKRRGMDGARSQDSLQSIAPACIKATSAGLLFFRGRVSMAAGEC
jgi:hypothetical protein